MERLTYRETDGHALLLYGADAKWRKTEQYGILDAAIQKLAAYEDSGLSPEDIPTALEMCKASMALDELKRYRDTGLTPELVRELQEKCNDCSRRKWYQMGYSDGRNCASDCPYNTDKPCPAAEGCPGYEDKKYCSTCKWYDKETEVCCNGESKCRAEFMDWDNTCDKWEEDTDE